jgi:hypothetical protein
MRLALLQCPHRNACAATQLPVNSVLRDLPLSFGYKAKDQFGAVFHLLDVEQLPASILGNQVTAFGVNRDDSLLCPDQKIRIEGAGVATIQKLDAKPTL